MTTGSLAKIYIWIFDIVGNPRLISSTSSRRNQPWFSDDEYLNIQLQLEYSISIIYLWERNVILISPFKRENSTPGELAYVDVHAKPVNTVIFFVSFSLLECKSIIWQSKLHDWAHLAPTLISPDRMNLCES